MSEIVKLETLKRSTEPDRDTFLHLPNFEQNAALVEWYGRYIAKKLGERATSLGIYNNWFTKPTIPITYEKYSPEPNPPYEKLA